MTTRYVTSNWIDLYNDVHSAFVQASILENPFSLSISYDNCTMDNWNKMQTVQHIHSHQQVEMVHNLSTSSSHNEEAEFRKSAAQIMQV